MRAAALVAFLLAQSIGPAAQQDPPFEDHRCTSHCAAIEKDSATHQACSCAATSGESRYCDEDGNRRGEEMVGCRNRRHCLRLCCHCCKTP